MKNNDDISLEELMRIAEREPTKQEKAEVKALNSNTDIELFIQDREIMRGDMEVAGIDIYEIYEKWSIARKAIPIKYNTFFRYFKKYFRGRRKTFYTVYYIKPGCIEVRKKTLAQTRAKLKQRRESKKGFMDDQEEGKETKK